MSATARAFRRNCMDARLAMPKARKHPTTRAFQLPRESLISAFSGGAFRPLMARTMACGLFSVYFVIASNRLHLRKNTRSARSVRYIVLDAALSTTQLGRDQVDCFRYARQPPLAE